MFTDRYGVPTDDSARDFTGTMEEFGPGDDYDPMDENAPGGTPRCGHGPFRDIPCCCDHDGKFVGPGCRECNPPDHECKPYGFGIERFEDPAMDRANRETKNRRPAALYTTAGAYARTYWTGKCDGRGRPVTGVVIEEPACANDTEWRDMLWRAYSTWDGKLARRSERIWTRLCEECETHTDAKAKYERWAKRAVARSNRKTAAA